MRRIPEREAAKVAGESTYFTGKACKNGHVSQRFTQSGTCKACNTEKTKRWQAKGIEHPAQTAARLAGLRHYSVGRSCRNGHADRRFVASGACVQCSINKCARWNERNPGNMAAGARRRRATDPTGHRAEVKRWRKKNRKQAQEAFKRWKAANKDHVRAMGRISSSIRRSRKTAAGGSFTLADIETLHARQNGTCAACPATECLEIDHVLPVVLGGTSDPSNLQLLCLPCNRSKGGKHPDLWRQQSADNGQVTVASVTKS